MASSFKSLHFLGYILPILLFISGGILRPVNGQATGQGSWCIARPSTSDQVLMDNINFACGFVDCSAIQQGGPCFYPTSLMNHASVVMNLYYQKLGKHYWNCDFKNSAIIVVTDPKVDIIDGFLIAMKATRTANLNVLREADRMDATEHFT